MTAEEQTHKSLEDINRKEKLSGTVVKTLLAGAIIDVGLEVPGIIHISQLNNEPINRVEDVIKAGQTVEVWVKRIFPKKKRIELTMIEPLQLEWREIEDGMAVKGTVTRLEKYGAFVEIGAERPGLVHISELTHGYIRTPEEAVRVGEEIEVKVLSVNRRRKQIKLSIKALMENPAEVAKKVQEPDPERDEQEKPVPTAMELALRQAMERSQTENGSRTNQEAPKKASKNNSELEGIFTRTLEQKK